MRRLSAEGSFSMAFVPVLAEYKEKHGPDAVKALVDRVAGALAAALLVVTALVLVFAPQLAQLIASRVTGDEHVLLTDMLRIMFPYALFISLASLAGGILNSYQRFAIPALSPILLNVAMIVCAIALAPVLSKNGIDPLYALAIGALVGGALQVWAQLPDLRAAGFTARLSVKFNDPHIREVICFALEKAGMQVHAANDGASALKTFERVEPSLIVLDVGMPQMDGLEVCRQIRRTSDVPILFLSARDEEIDRVLGLEMGGDDYVTKPFSPRELVARVNVILRRGRKDEKPATAEPLERGALRLDVEMHEAGLIPFWR